MEHRLTQRGACSHCREFLSLHSLPGTDNLIPLSYLFAARGSKGCALVEYFYICSVGFFFVCRESRARRRQGFLFFVITRILEFIRTVFVLLSTAAQTTLSGYYSVTSQSATTPSSEPDARMASVGDHTMQFTSSLCAFGIDATTEKLGASALQPSSSLKILMLLSPVVRRVNNAERVSA